MNLFRDHLERQSLLLTSSVILRKGVWCVDGVEEEVSGDMGDDLSVEKKQQHVAQERVWKLVKLLE